MLNSPALRLLAGLLIVSGLMFGAARWIEVRGDRTVAPPPASVLPASVYPTNAIAGRERADRDVAAARADSVSAPGSWVALESLARRALARFRLTADYADLAIAEGAITRAFSIAPAGAGPHLASAGVNASLHRLGRIEADLAAIDRYAVAPSADIRSEVDAMRGDINMYRGRYREALGYYERADQLAPSAGVAVRQANLFARTGAPGKALDMLDRAAGMTRFTTALAAANLLLQRGTIQLQRGDWNAAEKAFEEAAGRFAGDWLIEAHVAQMKAVRGDTPEAARRYEAILRRTPTPEVMDALAALYRAEGDFARSRQWSARAAPLWAERVTMFPEAAYAHAFEHELAFGDPKRALMLAQADYRARPHGGSMVALGWALLANGRAPDALAVLRRVNASEWRSAELHAATAQAHLLLGQAAEAEAARERALALNPRIFDRRASMIWFGH